MLIFLVKEDDVRVELGLVDFLEIKLQFDEFLVNLINFLYDRVLLGSSGRDHLKFILVLCNSELDEPTQRKHLVFQLVFRW